MNIKNLSKVKSLMTILLFISTFNFASAQYQIIIEINIKDNQTHQPISFVTINFQGKQIKTVSDSNGKIFFNFDEEAIFPNDTLQIEAHGYKTQKVTANQFYKFLKNTNTIYLNPINQKSIHGSNKGTIYGKVTCNNIPVQGARINIKNSLVATISNVDGDFRINAKEDDILVVSALGMLPKEVSVNNNAVNINLETDGELLDEVFLEGQGKQKDKVLDTGYGKKKFDAIGYDMYEMSKKEINPSIQTLDQVIRKIPGIIVSGIDPNGFSGNKRYTLLRSNASSIANDTNPIIVINDLIYYQSDGLKSLPQIDVQSITKVTLLKSLAATNRYGSAGAYGAIVIRTDYSSLKTTEPKKPSALVTGNDYVEQVQDIDALNFKPNNLQNTKSFEEAKQAYKELKQARDNLSVSFYLDAVEYFLKWDNTYAMSIFSDVEAIAKDNAKALKSIAFTYEALSMYEEARLVYQHIAILLPIDAQSYRDLALIYNATGYYNEAFQLYKQMLSNSMEGVDFTGLQQPIIDELMHLLAFHRSKVNFKDLPTNLLTAKFKQDLRIVFEWNDPNAEFELQFVNPQKKFFKWSHTKFNNRERMLDEIKKGYTTEAYIIDDAEAGEWIINIEALNEKPDINPNYLKYTIYKNYGLPNETKTIKILQLENIKQKVTLDKIIYE
jgi:tetratricopeptide (TPR) repeat protein